MRACVSSLHSGHHQSEVLSRWAGCWRTALCWFPVHSSVCTSVVISQWKSSSLTVQRQDDCSELITDGSRSAWGVCLQAGRLQACLSLSLSSLVNDSGRGCFGWWSRNHWSCSASGLNWSCCGRGQVLLLAWELTVAPPASTDIFHHHQGVNERPLGLIAHLSWGVCFASVFHLRPSLSSSSSAWSGRGWHVGLYSISLGWL